MIRSLVKLKTAYVLKLLITLETKQSIRLLFIGNLIKIVNTNTLISLTLIFLLSVKAFSQRSEIKGVILDTNEIPVENVNIISNSFGTMSNSNGFYSIGVDSNQDITIEFTHINYKKISLKFNLEPDEEFEFNPHFNLRTPCRPVNPSY